ncbi:MAG: cupredoxin family copper-binding protein [Alphaproteobacteria bacterium]|nr:cupredoxin family copper-binding protein [Alphaproteobacteria bacterium]
MTTFWPATRRAVATAAALVALVSSANWLARHGHAAAAAAPQVVIDDFTFGPAVMTVARGTTVTWTNKDDDPHTVASDGDPKLFKSPALDTDQSFAFTFNEAGTFKYFCTIHPRMRGTVVVQ